MVALENKANSDGLIKSTHDHRRFQSIAEKHR